MANYNIRSISKFEASAREKYFIDANIWIAVIKGSASSKRNRFKPYVDFFESIIEVNQNIITDPKVLKIWKKQGRFQPKIIMTSMLMSEIFNAYMRRVAMKEYYNKEELKTKEYKRDYRKTKDHANKLKRLKNEFLAYYKYMEIREDDFKKNDPKQVNRTS